MITLTAIFVLAFVFLLIVGAFQFVINCFAAVLSAVFSLIVAVLGFLCKHWFAILLACIVVFVMF